MNAEQRKQLAAIVGRLIGIETVWKDQSRPFVNPSVRAICLLSTTAHANVGSIDDIVSDYSEDRPEGEEIHETIRAVRTFTVTVECHSYEQTDSANATIYLERLRVRLSARSSRDALRACGLVLEGVERAIDLSETQDNRRVSISAFDMLLRATVAETVDRIGYIESVELVDKIS